MNIEITYIALETRKNVFRMNKIIIKYQHKFHIFIYLNWININRNETKIHISSLQQTRSVPARQFLFKIYTLSFYVWTFYILCPFILIYLKPYKTRNEKWSRKLKQVFNTIYCTKNAPRLSALRAAFRDKMIYILFMFV